MQELRELMLEICKEFENKKEAFFKTQRFSENVVIGRFALPDVKRKPGFGRQSNGMVYDWSSLLHTFSVQFFDYSSIKNLFKYIQEKNLWHEQLLPFDGNTFTIPTEMARIAGGFLIRNFELNNYEFVITDASFDKALSELFDILSKDTVCFTYYLNLKGITGDIDEIRLTEDVSIVRAGHEIAKKISITYTLPKYYDVEVYEDDFMLKIIFDLPKSLYKRDNRSKIYFSHKKVIIDKWKAFIALMVPNFLVFGKEIQLSSDWINETDHAFGPYGIERRILSEPSHVLTAIIKEAMENAARDFHSLESLNTLEKNILHCLNRIEKSKSTTDIDDRIIDLTIAFEYLINTDNQEVTLQLILKTIKLLNGKIPGDEVNLKLRKFYGLRSKVVHGNDVLKQTDLEYLNDAEEIVRQAILKMIRLNLKYSGKQINEQLRRGLYLQETIDELLENCDEVI
ncbi:MAG: hypothetical protein V4577_19850 [Bacteroidota bacterium]